MNIKNLIAEVRASKANVTNRQYDFEPWCWPIVEGIAGDAVLLADEVERLDAENATLRANLKHFEHALGDRVKPGQTLERAIADLLADMDRMAAQLGDAGLTLAADKDTP